MFNKLFIIIKTYKKVLNNIFIIIMVIKNKSSEEDLLSHRCFHGVVKLYDYIILVIKIKKFLLY